MSQGILAVQADGEIYEAGYIGNFTPGVERINANGTFDGTFYGTYEQASTARLALGDLTETSLLAVAIQPGSGQLLVAEGGTSHSLAGTDQGFTLSRILTSDTTGPAAFSTPVVPVDFRGQGYTSVGVYDPLTASFVTQQLTPFSSVVTTPFGTPGIGKTIPAAADYEGLGYDQLAAYLPDLGVYAIRPVHQGSGDEYLAIGIPGAGQTIPIPADYQGTGKADLAVYLPSQALFADAATGREVQFGTPGLGQSIPPRPTITGPTRPTSRSTWPRPGPSRSWPPTASRA